MKPRVSKLPVYVTEPSPNNFQARVCRQGKAQSACFSASIYGGREQAIRAASRWAEKMAAMLGRPANGRGLFKEKSRASKKSNLPVGVWETIRKNKSPKDRSVVSESIIFAACYMSEQGQQKIRTFTCGVVGQVGPRQLARARQSAIAFRKEWEYCRLTGAPFAPSKYRNWKAEKLYPFVGKNQKQGASR